MTAHGGLRRDRALGALAALGAALAVLGAGCSGAAVPVSSSPVASSPAAAQPAVTTVPIPSIDAGLPASTARLGQRVTRVDPPVIAPPLVMPDGRGGTFDITSLRGAPVFVYFGYTYCPDICPTSLGVLREVIAKNPEAQVVFVTVDPDRDTPEALAAYLAFFRQGWIGLSGDAAQTKAVADAWGVRYAKVETASAANGYAMAHTADIFLIDASGELRYRYPFGTGADEIVRDLGTLQE